MYRLTQVKLQIAPGSGPTIPVQKALAPPSEQLPDRQRKVPSDFHAQGGGREVRNPLQAPSPQGAAQDRHHPRERPQKGWIHATAPHPQTTRQASQKIDQTSCDPSEQPGARAARFRRFFGRRILRGIPVRFLAGQYAVELIEKPLSKSRRGATGTAPRNLKDPQTPEPHFKTQWRLEISPQGQVEPYQEGKEYGPDPAEEEAPQKEQGVGQVRPLRSCGAVS